MLKIVALCVALLAVSVQAVTELSPIAKDCITKTGIDTDSVLAYVGGSEIPEDNELARKFFECVFGNNINDDFEVIVNDQVKGLAKKILSDRLGSDYPDLEGVSARLLTECAAIKGCCKSTTAIKVTNCYGKKISELKN